MYRVRTQVMKYVADSIYTCMQVVCRNMSRQASSACEYRVGGSRCVRVRERERTMFATHLTD